MFLFKLVSRYIVFLRVPGGVNQVNWRLWPKFLFIVKPVKITMVRKAYSNETALLKTWVISITDPPGGLNSRNGTQSSKFTMPWLEHLQTPAQLSLF